MGECRQQKHTQHAPSTKTECDYFNGWIKKRSHAQKSHQKVVTPRDIAAGKKNVCTLVACFVWLAYIVLCCHWSLRVGDCRRWSELIVEAKSGSGHLSLTIIVIIIIINFIICWMIVITIITFSNSSSVFIIITFITFNILLLRS